MQRILEANLATTKDSADLLRAEIVKEEALLAEEKLSLQEVEKNAKRAEAERKRQMKNVCAKSCSSDGSLQLFSCNSDISVFRNTLSCASLTSSHKPIAKGAVNLHFWTPRRAK